MTKTKEIQKKVRTRKIEDSRYYSLQERGYTTDSIYDKGQYEDIKKTLLDIGGEAGGTGFVQIFTNTEAKPKNVDCTWFYQLIEESYEDTDLTTKKSGNATLCGCEECRSFGIEIYEFFSIYLALSSVKRAACNIEIELWVSSQKFLFDENEGVFSHYSEIYKCPFLRTLGKDLRQVFSELRIQVWHYSYANKDMISTFF